MKSLDPKLILEFFPRILPGLSTTLLIVAAATLAGLVLGCVIALVRVCRVPVLSWLCVALVSFLRGTPTIIQLFIVYYGLPVLLRPLGVNIARMEGIYFVILAFGLSTGAVFAESIRAAVLGVPNGQVEAGYSVGLTRLQTFRRIVAPQALLTALPGMASSIVGLLQNTSLAFTLGVVDVMGKVRVVGGMTQHYVEGYIVAAILFVAVSILLKQAFDLLEGNMKRRYAPVR